LTGLARTCPERIRALLDRFYDAMAAEVEWAGGTVEKFVGDAVMAAFGAPVAHEDDVERALHVALGMQRRLPELFGGRLALRIGSIRATWWWGSPGRAVPVSPAMRSTCAHGWSRRPLLGRSWWVSGRLRPRAAHSSSPSQRRCRRRANLAGRLLQAGVRVVAVRPRGLGGAGAGVRRPRRRAG